jgi:sulfite exporter TauE/SafE
MAALAAAAFAAGLLGGVHCAGMCGGIVAGLSAAARGPAPARQLAFNSGRIASYVIAGTAVGALGDLARYAPQALLVQTALFAVANVVMVLLGLYIAGWGSAVMTLERAGGFAWRRIQPVARRLVPIDSTARAFAAGLAWGWVPCGLVYTMIVMALASGSALDGALVMAAFGLGTLPTLLVAGMAAQRALAWRRVPWVRRGAGTVVILLALWGLARVPGLPEAVQAGWHACIG